MPDQIDIKIKTTADNEAVKQTAAEMQKLSAAAKQAGEQHEQADFKFGKVKKSLKELAHEVPGLGTAMFALANPMYAMIVAVGAVGAAIMKLASDLSTFSKMRYDFSGHSASMEALRDNIKSARDEVDALDKKLLELENKGRTPSQQYTSEKQKAERELSQTNARIGAEEKKQFAKVDELEKSGKMTPSEAIYAKQKIANYNDQQRQSAQFKAAQRIENAAVSALQNAKTQEGAAVSKYDSSKQEFLSGKPLKTLETEQASYEAQMNHYESLAKDVERRIGEYTWGNVDSILYSENAAESRAMRDMFYNQLTREGGGIPGDLKDTMGFGSIAPAKYKGAEKALPYLQESARKFRTLYENSKAAIAAKKAQQERMNKANTEASGAIKNRIDAANTIPSDQSEFIDSTAENIGNIKTGMEGRISESNAKLAEQAAKDAAERASYGHSRTMNYGKESSQLADKAEQVSENLKRATKTLSDLEKWHLQKMQRDIDDLRSQQKAKRGSN